MQNTLKSRRRLAPAERKAQLLEVAIEVYGDLGFGCAGHGDIAKKAKVSTATVFNYFPTVDDLNQAVIDNTQEKTRQLLLENFNPDAGLEQSAYPLAQAFIKLVRDNRSLTKLRRSWGATHKEPYRTQFNDYQDDVANVLSSVFGGGENAKRDAHITLALVERLGAHVLDDMPEEELEPLVRRTIEWITNRDG